jgi:hypothetical protein
MGESIVRRAKWTRSFADGVANSTKMIGITSHVFVYKFEDRFPRSHICLYIQRKLQSFQKWTATSIISLPGLNEKVWRDSEM